MTKSSSAGTCASETPRRRRKWAGPTSVVTSSTYPIRIASHLHLHLGRFHGRSHRNRHANNERSSLGLDESLRYDVEVIKNAPFLRKDLYVADYALDDSTGLERLVVEAGGPVASISSLQG